MPVATATLDRHLGDPLGPNWLVVTGGGLERHGLWGTPTNKNPPPKETFWEIYGDLTRAGDSASDHAAIFVDVNI